MKPNKETAIKLWNERYGNRTTVDDYSGRTMDKSAYGKRSSAFGWNIDHIRPESLGGTNLKCNLELSTIKTNQEKNNKFPHWKANNMKFKAKRIGKDCYKIIKG